MKKTPTCTRTHERTHKHNPITITMASKITFTCTSTHKRMRKHTHKHTHKHAHNHYHKRKHKHKHTQAHAQAHAQAQAQARAQSLSREQAQAQITSASIKHAQIICTKAQSRAFIDTHEHTHIRNMHTRARHIFAKILRFLFLELKTQFNRFTCIRKQPSLMMKY